MLDSAKIGEFLRTIRQKNGYTQSGLSSLLNISDKAVSRWESGLSLPDMDNMYALSKIYGVTVDDILNCNYKAIVDLDIRKGKLSGFDAAASVAESAPQESETAAPVVDKNEKPFQPKETVGERSGSLSPVRAVMKTTSAKFIPVLFAAYFMFGLYVFSVASVAQYFLIFAICCMVVVAVFVFCILRCMNILKHKPFYIILVSVYGLAALIFGIGIMVETAVNRHIGITYSYIAFLILFAMQTFYAAVELAGNEKAKKGFKVTNKIIALLFVIFGILTFALTPQTAVDYYYYSWEISHLLENSMLMTMILSFAVLSFTFSDTAETLFGKILFNALSAVVYTTASVIIISFKLIFSGWYLPESVFIETNPLMLVILSLSLIAFASESVGNIFENIRGEIVADRITALLYFFFAVWLGVYVFDVMIANYIIGAVEANVLLFLRLFILAGMILRGVYLFRFDKLSLKQIAAGFKALVFGKKKLEENNEN